MAIASQPTAAHAPPAPAPVLTSRRPVSALAFLSSLVFHLVLVLTLALCVYNVGKPSQGLMLEAEVGESDVVSLDLTPPMELEMPQELAPQASAAEVALEVNLDDVLPEPVVPDGLATEAALASATLGEVTERLSEPSRGRGASFFGSYAHGNRFVYVLDSSKSMRGDRWTYACNQLIDSLNGLKPGQEFFVICFDFEPSFMFNARPDRIHYAEIDNQVVPRVRNWLRSRTLGGATMPAEALQYALRMNPDAIFLLSDGELQDASVDMLRQINGRQSTSRQIPIHTVHLFSREGRFTLQQIAMENGGSFTPIEGR